MIRQGFQTLMTQTRGSTKFKPELFDFKDNFVTLISSTE